MPLITACIGLATAPIEHAVDARWTMAYSACLGDNEAVFLDTACPAGIVAHPLFAICPEWPVALASRKLLRERGLSADELARAVHASHDTHVLRLVRPGDHLSTTATILDIDRRRPGAFVTSCFDSRDQHGELVCRTFHGMLFRDVELMSVNKAPVANLETGIEVPPLPMPAAGAGEPAIEETTLQLNANFAHVYTECARIFNPIHTDAAAARAAGLPGIIVHGSATLALAVSAIMRAHGGGDPHRVKRISGQFRAFVTLPATLTLRCAPHFDHDGLTVVPFDIVNAQGAAVFSRGSVSLATPGQRTGPD